MKKRLIKNIAIFVVGIMCSVMACPPILATGSPVFTENFESQIVGTALGYNSRESVCSTDGDNKVVSIGVPASGYDNGRYLVRTDVEPSGKILISLDFKLPGEVNEYTSKLLETYYKDGKGSVADVLLKNGTLYTAKEGTTKEELRSDFESDKWYNIFIIIDKSTKTWKLYSGSFESGETDFSYPDPYLPGASEAEKEPYRKLLWPISIRNYNRNARLYIDNCVFTGILNEELDIAVYKARSIMLEAVLGYEDGQYPFSAMSMLEDTYNKISPYADDTSVTEEEAMQYTQELQMAIELFEKSKIDSTNSDGVPAYIVSAVPDIIVVDDENDYVGELNATVYDAAKNEVAGDIEWSLEEEYEGINIVDGKLEVSAGTDEIIRLKAACGDLYLRQTVKLTTGKKVEEISFVGENGSLEISGVMNRKPDLPVSLSIIGESINITDELIEVNEDKTFTWTGNVDAQTSFQNVEITFTGDDLSGTLTWTEPYYGVNWESRVLEKINSSQDKEEFETLILLYDKGLKIDEKSYTQNADVYNERLFSLRPYEEFSKIPAACAEIEYIIKHSCATRNEIEDILGTFMHNLKDAGFNTEEFNKLTETQKNGFYIDATLILVDVYQDTLSTIAEKLNDIVDEIKKDQKDENKRPQSSGGGGGGGGGSSSSSSSPSYKIELIEEKTENNTDKIEELQTVEPFADASSAPWANEALLFMRQEKIMEGDGTNVRPNDYITRGEFSKILVTAFKMTSDENVQNFTDGGKWWEQYAKITAACGIMTGIGEGKFGGDSLITREMLAVTIDRVVNANKIELYPQNNVVDFRDSEEISDYAKESVERLALKGIVSGVGNKLFAPKLSVTRAEAAQIIYNVLKQR